MIQIMLHAACRISSQLSFFLYLHVRISLLHTYTRAGTHRIRQNARIFDSFNRIVAQRTLRATQRHRSHRTLAHTVNIRCCLVHIHGILKVTWTYTRHIHRHRSHRSLAHAVNIRCLMHIHSKFHRHTRHIQRHMLLSPTR
jgi:hypothetical protein